MHRFGIRRAAAALLSAALLAGCASSIAARTVHPATDSIRHPIVPDRTSADEIVYAPYIRLKVTSNRTVTKAAASKLTSMPWLLLGSSDPSGNARTLEVYYRSGDSYCLVHAGIYVHETADEVLIAALSRSAHEGGCPADAVNGVSIVRLTRPLGMRRIVHAVVAPGVSEPAFASQAPVHPVATRTP